MHATAALVGFCAALLFSSSCLAQSNSPSTNKPTSPTLSPGSSTNATGVAQFGFAQSNAVSFIGTNAIQEAVFPDGLKFSVQAGQPLRMNVGMRTSLSRVTLPLGIPSLNTFAYQINTSAPNAVMTASIDVPINMDILDTIVPDTTVFNSTVRGAVLMVARRPLNGGAIMYERLPGQPMPFVPLTPGFSPMQSITISNLDHLDGEYVVLVANPDDESIFDTVQQKDKVKQAVDSMSGSGRSLPAALLTMLLLSSVSAIIPML